MFILILINLINKMLFIPDYWVFQKSISAFVLGERKVLQDFKKEFLLFIKMVNGKFWLKQFSKDITIAED